MSALIISSTSASTGKTAICAALADRLCSEGAEVRVDYSLDTRFRNDPRIQFVDRQSADSADDKLAVIEGSVADAASDLELAERLDAHIVLICQLEDDIPEIAARYKDRLGGIIFNKVPRYRDTHVRLRIGELSASGMPCLGWLPEDRCLAAQRLDDIVSHLGAEVIIEGNGLDVLIDNYLIGGLVLDWGPFYFKSQENICVFVRGGRPDVQISALQSDTTRAIVMTGGENPIDYVFYEARTKGIPLISTAHDTVQTMNRLDAMRPSMFDHPDKLRRIAELADVQSITAKLTDLIVQPATR